jgi:hypothetical protein
MLTDKYMVGADDFKKIVPDVPFTLTHARSPHSTPAQKSIMTAALHAAAPPTPASPVMPPGPERPSVSPPPVSGPLASSHRQRCGRIRRGRRLWHWQQRGAVMSSIMM